MFGKFVSVALMVDEKVERNYNGKDSFHMEKSAGRGVLTSSETRHPKRTQSSDICSPRIHLGYSSIN
jgi:hypothetical protein